ncbi:MAG: energy transducer TonB [Pseudomonadota bacterium]
MTGTMITSNVQSEAADLRVVLARTSAGQAELRQPRAGLSLPQRKLLTLVDGERSLAVLAVHEPALHADRLVRDAAVLLRLDLVAAASAIASPAGADQRPVTVAPSAQADAATPTRPATQPDEPTAANTRSELKAQVGTVAQLSERRSMAVPAALGVVVLAGAIAAGYTALGGSAAPQVEPSQPVARAATAPTTPAPTASATAPRPPSAPVADSAPARANPPTGPTSQAGAAAAKVAVDAPKPAAPAPSTTGPRELSATAPIPQRTVPADAPTRTAPATAPVTAATPATAVGTSRPALPAAAATPAPTPAATPAAGPAASVAPVAPVASSVPDSPLQPLRRMNPEFPPEAVRQGIDQGTVRARLRIGADGRVESVTTSAAAQSRVFERAARTALAEWSFPPGEAARVYEVQLDFRR